MKNCQICGAVAPDDAVTCVACGEGTFAGGTVSFDAVPVEAAPLDESQEQAPKSSRGRR